MRSLILVLSVLAGCASSPAPVDTGTSPNPADTAGDSGKDTGTDTGTDTGKDSGDTAKDTGKDTGDTGKDTGADTGKDTGTDTGKDTGTDTAADRCPDSDPCVVYACYCGACTSADIQCVKQSWADANPCLLGCAVQECPELDTTTCGCDEASGACLKL